MECLGFLSLRTSQLGRGGRKVSPPSDRWLVTIEFLVVCSSTAVGYEWDTSSLGYWFPSALSVYCWWCLGSPEFPNDHQEPWTALSIYPCVQVHEPWKAPLWWMCKHKVEGSPEEGKNSSRLLPRAIFASLISSPELHRLMGLLKSPWYHSPSFSMSSYLLSTLSCHGCWVMKKLSLHYHHIQDVSKPHN